MISVLRDTNGPQITFLLGRSQTSRRHTIVSHCPILAVSSSAFSSANRRLYSLFRSSFRAAMYVCAICSVSNFESFLSFPKFGTTSLNLSSKKRSKNECKLKISKHRGASSTCRRRSSNCSFVGVPSRSLPRVSSLEFPVQLRAASSPRC